MITLLNFSHQTQITVCPIQRPTRQQLEQNGAECVEVGADIDIVLASELLRLM